MVAQHMNLLSRLLAPPQLLGQPAQLTRRVTEPEEEEEIFSGTEIGVERDQSEAGLDQGGVEAIPPECQQILGVDMSGPAKVMLSLSRTSSEVAVEADISRAEQSMALSA